MDRVRRTIQDIKEEEWYGGQIEHVEELPQREAKHGEANLSPRMKSYLDEKGVRLYTHQAEAINSIQEGRDAVITTPTASGKTLAFNVPVLETLMEDPDATALYLYPTKALSNDQLENLKETEQGLDADVNPAVYDGDTPKNRRPRIRRESRIILTNPYGLHHYLAWHGKWRKFFQNLRYVVMDEVHNYRGVFGSNVAMLTRRLRRILQNYGSDPRFVLSSATIANPDEHSKKLTGKNFEVIDEDGSESGRKHFVFWNPVEYPDRSIHRQTSDLLSTLVEDGLQTLCFTVSRRMAELVAKWSQENAPRHDIRAYRAGYLPEERRKIEEGLRTGEVEGAASTNALELGVDIGGLDAVLMSGYPGTVVSTWQQAGRAGRGREESAALLLAFENPLDQYFMKHPEKFFGKPHEHAIIDPDNPNIAMGHLMCAANELPLKENEPLATVYQEELEALEAEGILRKTPAGHVYVGEARPAAVVKLGNISQETVKVFSDGELLETMDLGQAYREAHEGAVLLHQGETHLVEELDLQQNTATVQKIDVDYYTEALKQTDIEILQSYRDSTYRDVEVVFGDVKVSEHYTKYRIKKYDEVLGMEPLDLPPIRFETEGTWINIPKEIVRGVEDEGLDPHGGIHAVEHAMIAMIPYHAMCDRWDLGGVSTTNHRDTGGPSIFVYDAFEGGIGIAEKSHELIHDILKTTHELVKDCGCEGGCPSCIHSPKCGNENEPLDKEAAIHMLTDLLGELSEEEYEE